MKTTLSVRPTLAIQLKPANRLKELRTEAGVRVMQLAVAARCSSQTIGAVERFGLTPGQDTQSRIAQALGVDATEIWPATGHAPATAEKRL